MKKNREVVSKGDDGAFRMSTGYKMLRFFLGGILRGIFLVRRINMSNEPPESRNYIVCANHISAIDPILIGASLRHHQPCYMAKKELFSVPVIGSIIKAFGAFPVNRESGNAGTVLHTIKLLKSGRTVVMFPQGTRCSGKDPATTKVRNGVGMIVAKSATGVLPIYIKTKGNKWRFLRPIKVIIGKPIPFEELGYDPDGENEYQRISQYVFGRICDLGKEADKND